MNRDYLPTNGEIFRAEKYLEEVEGIQSVTTRRKVICLQFTFMYADFGVPIVGESIIMKKLTQLPARRSELSKKKLFESFNREHIYIARCICPLGQSCSYCDKEDPNYMSEVEKLRELLEKENTILKTPIENSLFFEIEAPEIISIRRGTWPKEEPYPFAKELEEMINTKLMMNQLTRGFLCHIK